MQRGIRQAVRCSVLFTAAMLVGVGVVGCTESQQGTGPMFEVPEPSGERLAEAIKLTQQGERAQIDGNTEAAMGFYREATQLSADAPAAAWNNLGVIHTQRGEYLDAVNYLRTASQLAPQDPQPMYNLGYAYSRSGWDRKALDAFKLALEREPNYIEAIRGAAKATMRLRLTDLDALERLKHAMLVETDPAWRAIFEREHLSMEARLEAADR